MFDFVRKFERGMTVTLIGLMCLVVAESVASLAWVLVKDLIQRPVLLAVDDLIDIFAAFLLVLIGLELLDTLKAHVRETVFRAEVILLVAMIAISRKIITLEIKHTEPAALFGIAAALFSLAVAYFLIRRTRGRTSAARTLRPPDED